MGISSKDPIMSWVDLTNSPLYASSSTSGTSGCKNWDFSNYLEYERTKFVTKSFSQILAESSRGYGSHIKALSMLMACPTSSYGTFAVLLLEQSKQTYHVVNSYEQGRKFIIKLSEWIKEHSVLSEKCQFS